jgi:hypothetical protein
MGVKHLKKIEEFLTFQSSPVPITTIRDSLKIDLNTVKECLDYLENQNKIKLIMIDSRIKYKWR